MNRQEKSGNKKEGSCHGKCDTFTEYNKIVTVILVGRNRKVKKKIVSAVSLVYFLWKVHYNGIRECSALEYSVRKYCVSERTENDMKQQKSKIDNKKATGKKKGQQEIQGKWAWKLLPLQFIVAFLPLIVKYYAGVSGYSVYPWHGNQDEYGDIFLHYKMVVFMVVALVMLGLAIYKITKLDAGKRKKTLLLFIPMVVYFVCVVLSTIFSVNLEGSLFGTIDQKEPVGVQLGYIVTVLYAFLVVETLEDVRQLLAAGAVGGTLMAAVGMLQVSGHDPLLWEWVQRLFAGNYLIDTYGAFNLVFPKGQAYGTLFNPNYVGSYVALYVPVLLCGMLVFKKVWNKLICAASFLCLLVMLFASQSRTGLLAVVLTIVVCVVFLSKDVLKRWYLVIPGITMLLMMFSLFDTYRDNALSNRLLSMFTLEKSQDALKWIDTTAGGVKVGYKDTEFTVRMDFVEGGFYYTVREGKEEKELTAEENNFFSFTLSTGDTLQIQTAQTPEGMLLFGLNLDGVDYYFANYMQIGNYKYLNNYGVLDECVHVANVFPGYERVASSRGYVWGRAIPVILENFFIGSGPDTFAVEFPQNDYVARIKIGMESIYFSRPHNFYIQMGVQTGAVSLLAFLAFYLIYFFGCLRRYVFRKFTSAEQWIGFAVFMSSIGFLIAGLANDSLIVVTPVFYVLLGMGMAINARLCPVPKKEKKTETAASEVEEAVAE